jgi:hypothetical protein
VQAIGTGSQIFWSRVLSKSAAFRLTVTEYFAGPMRLPTIDCQIQLANCNANQKTIDANWAAVWANANDSWARL